MPATANLDTAHLASDLRVVLGQLVRRLRAEHRFSLSHGAVLGRLDRGGPQSVSDLAAAERVRPQSMAQTVGDLETGGLVSRQPDPADGRRALVAGQKSGVVHALDPDEQGKILWQERVGNGGTLATEDARRILYYLALALDYAHHEGVVHRDLKA